MWRNPWGQRVGEAWQHWGAAPQISSRPSQKAGAARGRGPAAEDFSSRQSHVSAAGSALAQRLQDFVLRGWLPGTLHQHETVPGNMNVVAASGGKEELPGISKRAIC